MRLPPAAIIPQYYRQYYPQYHPIYLDIARGGIVGRKAGCEGAAFQPRADGNPERLAARNESPARGREPVPGTALQPSESHGVCGPRSGRVAATNPLRAAANPKSGRRLQGRWQPSAAGVARRRGRTAEGCTRNVRVLCAWPRCGPRTGPRNGPAAFGATRGMWASGRPSRCGAPRLGVSDAALPAAVSLLRWGVKAARRVRVVPGCVLLGRGAVTCLDAT